MLWWALLSAGVVLAERTPPSLLYGAGRAVAGLLAALPTAARNRLQRNLARVTGLSLGDRRLDQLVRWVYATQVANYLDLLRIRKLSVPEVAGRFRLEGPGWAPFVEHVRSGKGAVLVTPHFGRIEQLNHCLAQFRLPTTLPVERLKPERLYALVSRLRGRTGVRLAPHDLGPRPWLRALREGHVVALFAEWDPSGRGVPVRFFDGEARFPPGPAFLALRGGAPLYVGLWLPGETPERYVAYLYAPLEIERSGDVDRDVQALTQRIATHFERHIRDHPGCWVMFHDLWAGGVSESAATD
jgi:KDO2-lipid IV(A) lauroyltransferase